MSRRETDISVNLQQWRGVDQRTSPTLVQDGFFVMSRGVYFGLGDNCERVPGKVLSGLLDGPVFQISQFGNNVLIQSMGKLWFTDVQGLIDADIVFYPDAPDAPDLSNVSYRTLDITMPAAYPLHGLSFSLQRSTDNTIWSTIATGLAPLQVISDSGLDDDTLYYYRLLAVGTGGIFTPGPSANATTLDATVTDSSDTVVDGGITVKGF